MFGYGGGQQINDPRMQQGGGLINALRPLHPGSHPGPMLPGGFGSNMGAGGVMQSFNPVGQVAPGGGGPAGRPAYNPNSWEHYGGYYTPHNAGNPGGQAQQGGAGGPATGTPPPGNPMGGMGSQPMQPGGPGGQPIWGGVLSGPGQYLGGMGPGQMQGGVPSAYGGGFSPYGGNPYGGAGMGPGGNFPQAPGWWGNSPYGQNIFGTGGYQGQGGSYGQGGAQPQSAQYGQPAYQGAGTETTQGIPYATQPQQQ